MSPEQITWSDWNPYKFDVTHGYPILTLGIFKYRITMSNQHHLANYQAKQSLRQRH